MRHQKIASEVVNAIRADKIAGMRQRDIAAKHNVSPASVCRILRGSRHAPKRTQAEAEA